MSQPERFVDSRFPTCVCKLHKALYDLKQAPRAWFDKLKGALVEKGFQTSVADTSLFVLKTSTIHILVLVYVDDIIVAGSDA